MAIPSIYTKSQHRDRTHARTDTQRQTHQAQDTADTQTADTHTSESQPRPKHTQPTATPNRNPPLTPARRLTPVALSREYLLQSGPQRATPYPSRPRR